MRKPYLTLGISPWGWQHFHIDESGIDDKNSTYGLGGKIAYTYLFSSGFYRILEETEMNISKKLLMTLMLLLVMFVFISCNGGSMEKLWEDELNDRSKSGDTLIVTVVISGEAKYGETLTLSIDPVLPGQQIQWYRDGEPISGATGTTYTLTADDIGHKITASVTNGGNTYTSAPTAAIEKADGPAAPEGLGAGSGIITGLDSTKLYEYSPDGGSTWIQVPAGSDTITGLDNDTTYEVRIQGTDTEEPGEPASVLMPGTLSGTVGIDGTPKYGETLTMTYDKTGPTYDIQWYRDGEPISGATGTTYTLTAADIGKQITVAITGTGLYTGELTSEAVTVEKADGPAAPTGLAGVAPETAGGSDGKITGLDTGKTYQYSADGGSTWTDVAAGSSEVTGLAAGDYSVREKIADSTVQKDGESVTVTVPARYAVTLDKNGGSSDGSATVVNNAASLTGITHAQYTGYTLTGYWTATSGGAKVLNGDGTFAATNVTDYITGGKWTKAGDCTLYAQWLANAGISPENKSVDVTLDYTSGGTVYPSYDSEHVTVRTGETIKLVFTSPTAAGRTLEGFYVDAACTTKVAGADGTLLSNVSGYTDDSGRWTKAYSCTLYAGWSCIISFRAGKGSGTMNDVEASRGASCTVPASTFTAPGFTAKEGTVPATHENFTGWNTKADGTGTAYAANATIPAVTSDMTLYAQWAKPYFSVSATKKVYFAKGNLQAVFASAGSTKTWQFAENQYDYVGKKVANTKINGNGSVSAAGTVDLFGWSTDDTCFGINTSEDNADYSGDFVDWGKNIGDGSTWRTLSADEYIYLFTTRTNASSLYKFGVTVCGKTGCLIIAPDGYTETIAASYNALTWSAAEAAGLVCLPAAGDRKGSKISSVGVIGRYWASSDFGGYGMYAYDVFIRDYVSPGYYEDRHFGCSVRLVCGEKN